MTEIRCPAFGRQLDPLLKRPLAAQTRGPSSGFSGTMGSKELVLTNSCSDLSNDDSNAFGLKDGIGGNHVCTGRKGVVLGDPLSVGGHTQKWQTD